MIFCSNEFINITNCRGYACGQAKVDIAGIWIVSAEINLPKIEPLGRKIQIYYGDDYPRAEIHEILHALGFNHINNTGSVMYPDVSQCSDRIPEIDQEIINKIKGTYWHIKKKKWKLLHLLPCHGSRLPVEGIARNAIKIYSNQNRQKSKIQGNKFLKSHKFYI